MEISFLKIYSGASHIQKDGGKDGGKTGDERRGKDGGWWCVLIGTP